MAGQPQKEILPDLQCQAPGSSSLSLPEVLAASLAMAIESRRETSMMESKSKWHISTSRHLQLYDVRAFVQRWESSSLALVSAQPYLRSALPFPLQLSKNHKSPSPFPILSSNREFQSKHEINPGSHAIYRRNVPQKAWTSGMNPITQRSTTSGQQNGVGPQAKNNVHRAAINQEASIEKLANERLMYLLVNFMVSDRDETKHS